MNYQFPPDIGERLKARVGNGRHQNEDEVLRDATDALDQLEQDKLIRWDGRNRIAMRQSQEGLSTPLDDEAVLSRLRERLAKEGIVDLCVLHGRIAGVVWTPVAESDLDDVPFYISLVDRRPPYSSPRNLAIGSTMMDNGFQRNVQA